MKLKANMLYRTSETNECHIYVLHRRIFESALKSHPETKKFLTDRAVKRHNYFKRVSRSIDKRYRMLLKNQSTRELDEELNYIYEEEKNLDELVVNQQYSDDELVIVDEE